MPGALPRRRAVEMFGFFIREEEMACHVILRKLLLGLLSLILVSSCASPIARKYHQEAAPGLTFSMVLENPSKHTGETVIWGGTIIRTVNSKEGSELFVLELPLGLGDRPKVDENPHGRFIAESKGYLDPLVYRRGRKVTVAGTIAGQKEVISGKSKLPYVYPVVALEEVYLWKKERPVYPYYPYWPGWGGPYYWSPAPWPYWGGFYGEGFYGDEFGEDEEFEGGHEFEERGGRGEERGR
jgi:outer membrane lipoprotein